MTRRIAIASAVWGASILLSRLIGIVREAVLGRTLGLGAEADLYATAFTVPDFLGYLLAAGALSIVFIPIQGAHLARGDVRAANESFSVVANALALFLLVIGGAVWIAMPHLAPIAAPGFDSAQIAELVGLSRIVLAAQAFHVLGGLAAAALQARDKHAIAALAPLLYTVGIIVGGLVGGSAAGARGFAWGVLGGSFVGPFLVPWIAAHRAGVRWRFTLDLAHPDLRTYLVRSLPIMVGFSIVVVDDWYLKALGSRLGEGSAATLSYAKTLMRVPMGVFGLAAGIAAFPTLQRLAAEGRRAEMHALLGKAARTVLVLSLAAQAVLLASGREIAALVYGRSRIDAAQIDEIGVCLALVSLGLCAWSVQPLFARGFYALGNTWMPAVLGTFVAAAAYPLYRVAESTHGVRGLALASSLAIVVYAIALARSARRTIEGEGALVPFAFLARVLVAMLAGAAAGFASARSIAVEGAGADVVRGSVGAVVALVVFTGLARAFRVAEVVDVLALLGRKLRRTAD